MLELKDITKTYRIEDIETKALDGISVSFRDKEFVAILGKSGSGKTTTLNIIGGLDRYSTGDLIIKGKSTKQFKDSDWDAYRNNTIGFIFQSYNLISHLSIVENVEMGMTLSGVSGSEKKRRAKEVLEQVGLADHLHKRPNQLSGGQMQRVAIARALANDPEILLCDEPTGALDTTTSVQIMELIKEISKDKLVIMVTHNPELAESYADRIIEFKDGHIESDSNPYEGNEVTTEFKLKKTSMRRRTALRLSYNNLKTKKGRTFLTAFASSIGIIGIAVILSLSTGFQTQIINYQEDALSEYPITISKSAMEVDMNTMMEQSDDGLVEYPNTKKVYSYDPAEEMFIHTNAIDDTFVEYIEDIDPSICKSIGYVRTVNMNLIRKDNDQYYPVSFIRNSEMAMMSAGLSTYPISLGEENSSYLEETYDLLGGTYPKDKTDLVLVVDKKNRVDQTIFQQLGLDTTKESFDFKDIVGTEIKLVMNDDYYKKTKEGIFTVGSDLSKMYDSEKSITLKVVGIIRKKDDDKATIMGEGIVYSDQLSDYIIQQSKDSEIVKAQIDASYNVMTREELDEETKESMLSYLGADTAPMMITVYPSTFENKEAVLDYLDQFNKGKDSDDKIVYTDLADTITSMTGGIMDGITIVLVAFASISLVVSLIMICIITYTSVLERKKEIGILKALGARKKDITRVFDAETFILGVFSGVLGIATAYLLSIPINRILYSLTELENVSNLQISHAIILICISTILTVIGGHIPARMASKKDAVEALRSE